MVGVGLRRFINGMLIPMKLSEEKENINND
ncbi:MAG: hypothetical protein ACI9SC_002400 [Gammaproteobacteria bacterium]|jgi:hypothetical protein